jgi:hypothetical protein
VAADDLKETQKRCWSRPSQISAPIGNMSLPTSLPTPRVCLERTVVCVAQHSMAEMRTASVNPPRNRGRQQRFPRLRKTSPPSAAASRRVRPHLVRGPITFCFSSLPVYEIGPSAEAVVELAEEKRKPACWCATRRRCACRGRRGGTFDDADVALQIDRSDFDQSHPWPDPTQSGVADERRSLSPKEHSRVNPPSPRTLGAGAGPRNHLRQQSDADHGRINDPGGNKQSEVSKEPEHLDGHSTLCRIV